jgi:hypothetical protein
VVLALAHLTFCCTHIGLCRTVLALYCKGFDICEGALTDGAALTDACTAALIDVCCGLL